MDLTAFFAQNPRAALAFSGGTDSAYLLYAARTAGAEVHPYFIKTAFQPASELSDAQRLTNKLNIPLTIIETNILTCPEIAANPPDRCYYCKRTLFSLLRDRARADGFPLIIDGTNASDDGGDRPGMRALRELGICSPLRLCGLTKAEVRRRSREAGLFTADKPSYACLATRLPAGEIITAERLAQLEAAEQQVARLGFTDFRVRYFHGAARLQFTGEQLPLALSRREALREALADFSAVLLDLKERPGLRQEEQNG